jgi:hypothetical protein
MVDLFKLKTAELKILVGYKNVLEKNKNFPQDYWTKEKYQIGGIKVKCKILTRYCLENLAHLEPCDLPKYDFKEIKEEMIKRKLFGMIQIVFNHDVLAMLKNAYPEEFRTRQLKEWMWSKHGLWHDDNLLIEAVQDMVRKEGIRRITDIPTLDWKRRLLNHGIYNILPYFNYSIYAMFNFVYPDKFHKTDFKYKVKWKASESLENAFYYMHKTFKQKRYKLDEILLLGTADFRRLGLAGMLIIRFNSSTLLAKEYYLYKTLGNEENRNELINDIKELLQKKRDLSILKRLEKAAEGKYIYNLHKNYTLYGFIKRHAKKNQMTIDQFITKYGFIYKSAKKDFVEISKEELWDLRKTGLSYIEIAQKMSSNPTTISNACKKYFGGDPLIPRPIEEYITVQELMNKFRVDHKTVMKLVAENNFENHTTLRLRYLKKSQIVPALEEYVSDCKLHKSLVNRYTKVKSDIV